MIDGSIDYGELARGPAVPERSMHRRFGASAIGGEWFTPSPAMEALIVDLSVMPSRALREQGSP